MLLFIVVTFPPFHFSIVRSFFLSNFTARALIKISSLIHFPLLRHPIPPLHLVRASLPPPPALALSLSLHRHPYLCIPLSSRFIRYNKYY